MVPVTRGPKPKPLRLRVINGNATAEQRENQAVSYTPVVDFPSPPAHLNEDGRELWNTMSRELVASRVMEVVDIYALQQLAYLWQRHLQKARANEDMNAAENTVIKALLAEFGATPSSRRRVAESGSNSKTKNRFRKFKRSA